MKEQFEFILFLSQFSATLFLTGLIWLIQLVHYPSFKWIDAHKFSHFAQFHSKSISKIVIPIMFFELITAFSYFWVEGLAFSYLLINLLSILLIWLSTFFISVPLHQKIQRTHCEESIDQLIRTNWIRTILWSIRSLGLIFFYIKIRPSL